MSSGGLGGASGARHPPRGRRSASRRAPAACRPGTPRRPCTRSRGRRGGCGSSLRWGDDATADDPGRRRCPRAAAALAAAVGVAAGACRPAAADRRAGGRGGRRADRDRSRRLRDVRRRRRAGRWGPDRGDRRAGADRRGNAARRALHACRDRRHRDRRGLSDRRLRPPDRRGSELRRRRDAGPATAAPDGAHPGRRRRSHRRTTAVLAGARIDDGAVVGSYAVVTAARGAAAPWPSTGGSRPGRR